MSKKQRQYYDTPTDAFQAMQSKSIADLRREYSALRDIAQKRVGRLKENFSGTQLYQDYVNSFPLLREIGKTDKKYLAEALADVSRFLQMKESTLPGIRAQQAREAEGSGLTIGGMEPREYQKFREYMRDVRNTKGLHGSYNKFRRDFRAVLEKSRRGEIDLDKVVQDFKDNLIIIGSQGGIYDASTQRQINDQWSKMG